MVTITDKETNKTYKLEFDRKAVKHAESKGFKWQDAANGEKPVTSTSDLFFYAFHKNHPEMTQEETDTILFDKMGGVPEGLLADLIDMYTLPMRSLILQDAERKNSPITVTL